jgi:hypothetical protein
MSGSYSVSDEAALNAAILAIDTASLTAPAGTAYSITITGKISMTTDLAAITLANGDSLSISGDSAKPDHLTGGSHRGFVVESGNVTLAQLDMSGFAAKGGAGGSGQLAGGGGAGLGGALFVGADANVTLAGVGLSNNKAAGGAAGKASKTGMPVGAGGAGEPGGFGAGGAGGVAGGFGGGGGTGAAGGFGAGGGVKAGGGLGAGGNVFVQSGGVLNFSSGNTAAGTVTAGSPGGQAYGNNIFIQGNTTITIGSVQINGVIADQASGGGGAAGTLLIDGNASLLAVNTYTGGTLLDGGSLTLVKTGSAGTGEISFTPGVASELIVGPKATVTNLIGGFVTGDVIDVQGVGQATGFKLSGSDVLTLQGTTTPVSFSFDSATNYANYAFVLQPDTKGTGTDISVITTHFVVASEAEFNAALAMIDKGGIYAQPGEKYSISLSASFTLSSDLYAINLAAGSAVSIAGNGQTIDGAGTYRGLFVYGGAANVSDLTIADATASGGAGGNGSAAGAGGAGLGGGLFVAAGTAVTLNDVNFVNDSATGGAAGLIAGSGAGGGGGLGGNGGNATGRAGGGGGIGTGATGGVYGTPGAGGGGLLIGGGSGNNGLGTYVDPGYSPGAGGVDGGGGGMAGEFSGSGRDPRSYPGDAGAGGDSSNANFGGGGGTVNSTDPAEGVAGFGGGSSGSGGPAGYGGGGVGSAGGFGGGGGAGGVGGGLGAGGDVFVQQGGTLTITGGSAGGGTVAGGTGSNSANNGSAYGSGIFFQGGNTLTYAPLAGQTVTMGDVIADEAGVSGSGGIVGLTMSGPGGLVLSASNAYSGGTALNGGTLSLQAPLAAGSGTITFGYGGNATLVVGAGDVPGNTLAFFIPGDVIDLQGVGTETSAILGANDVLSITGGATPVKLQFSAAQDFAGETFAVTSDKNGGTLLTAVDKNNDLPPAISGMASNGNDHAPFDPLQDITVSTLISGQIETATLSLSTAADGTLSNFGGGSYDAANLTYSDTGTAAQITNDLRNLIYTPTEYQTTPGNTVNTGFSLAVTDGTMQAATPFNVAVTALNDPPVVSGGTSWQDAYWNVPFNVFAGVTITDPNYGASETVTLSGGLFALAAPVDGVSLTEVSAGIYTLSAGSPAAVTAALDAVTFTPTTSNPALGFTISNLGVSVSDGIAPPATATYNVSAGLPILTGVPATQSVASKASIAPFSTGVITDSAYFTSESVSIILTPNGAQSGPGTDADGTLTGTGLTKTGVGTYVLAAGSPAAVTSELESLVFHSTAVAAGQTATTGFIVSIFDGATTSDWYNDVVTLGPGAVMPAAKMGFLAPAIHAVAEPTGKILMGSSLAGMAPGLLSVTAGPPAGSMTHNYDVPAMAFDASISIPQIPAIPLALHFW